MERKKAIVSTLEVLQLGEPFWKEAIGTVIDPEVYPNLEETIQLLRRDDIDASQYPVAILEEDKDEHSIHLAIAAKSQTSIFNRGFQKTTFIILTPDPTDPKLNPYKDLEGIRFIQSLSDMEYFEQIVQDIIDTPDKPKQQAA